MGILLATAKLANFPSQAPSDDRLDNTGNELLVRTSRFLNTKPGWGTVPRSASSSSPSALSVNSVRKSAAGENRQTGIRVPHRSDRQMAGIGAYCFCLCRIDCLPAHGPLDQADLSSSRICKLFSPISWAWSRRVSSGSNSLLKCDGSRNLATNLPGMRLRSIMFASPPNAAT